MFLHGLEDGAPGHLRNPQGLGQRRGNQGGVGQRGQIREEGAISVLGQGLGGNLEGQPGLPGTTGPSQGEEPGLAEEPPYVRDLLLPTHERRELKGEVVRPGVERPGRREVGREALDHEVVEVLGLVDVFQPVFPEVPERGTLGKATLHEPPRGLGDDDLPPVGRVGDPRAPVHVDSDIVVPARNPLARVQTHPDPQGRARGPVVGGQAPLGRHRGLNGLHRIGEHDEEGVPLGADLHPAGFGGGSANDRGVLVPDHRVTIAELLEQPG